MTTATSYVRRATAAGAAIAPASSRFVQDAVDHLALLNTTGLDMCEHAVDTLRTTVALFPTFGDRSHQLLCPTCWVDPGRAAGCQACDRTPAPGLRRVLSPTTYTVQHIVIVGQLCVHDRRRLA